MRFKIVLIFILSILIPTGLLAYFGLKAVRSEKAIVESSIKQRYETMADIVENDIKSVLSGLSGEFFKNTRIVESIILDQASIFKDQVVITDDKGVTLGDANGKNHGRARLQRIQESA